MRIRPRTHMKTAAFVILAIFATIHLGAQPAQTQPTSPPVPGAPVGSVIPGLPASPVSPGLPASADSEGLPGFTNRLGNISLTNQFGTNFPANLGPLLANLQNDLSQLLPVLAAFNNSFVFANLGPATTPPAQQGTGLNLSRDVSGNSSVNLGQNLGTVIGGTSPSVTAGTNVTAGTVIAPPTATGVTNAFGLAPGLGGT